VPLTSDPELAKILEVTRSIAVLGASSDPARPSYRVTRFLIEEGYAVHLVNPVLAEQFVHGRPVWAGLADVPAAIDMVDVFRQPQFLPGIIREAIALGIATVWTQLGVVNPAAAREAEANGLQVVMDRCPAIEIPKLRGMGLLAQVPR
jgi:predicted CoA-binding protein